MPVTGGDPYSQWIVQDAPRYGIDPRAAYAISMHEWGRRQGAGDQGTSFGPFQLHVGGELPSGRGRSWAESRAGVDYALQQMAVKGARGLRGQAAISNISRNFERPADPGAEIRDALTYYGRAPGAAGGINPSLRRLAGTAVRAPVQAAQGNADARRAALVGYLLSNVQNYAQTGHMGPNPQGLTDLAMALRQNQAAPQPTRALNAPVGASKAFQGVGQFVGKAGGFLDRTAPYKPGRADQGRDGQTRPGAPIRAPGAGYVVRVGSDPNGFGPNYPVVHFTSGRYAGRTMYVGHTHAAVHPGQRFSPGQVISTTGTSPVGNAGVPGWFEIGYAPGGTPGKFGQMVPF